MNWRKLIICCVSFFLVFFGEIAINIACGPMQDPYDYYISFFHNNTQGEGYTPFAFNGLLYLNGEEDVWNEKDVNSVEWAAYLKVKKQDVRQLMYDLDSASAVKLNQVSFRVVNELPDSLKKNTFLMALNKNHAALMYYRLVKACEPMISGHDWKPLDRDSTFIKKNADKALQLLKEETDPFLKLRYAYQAQRLYFYGGSFEESKTVYEQYIDGYSSPSAIKGWAMSNYAGILRNEGKIDQAAYLFSKVFANNPERRITAYRNYFWTKAKLSDVLKFAKNDDEKANIYAIHGFREPSSDIQHVKEVYECNPNSPLVGALLIREVNKLEQNLLERSAMAYDFFSSYEQLYWSDQHKNADSLRKANSSHLAIVKDFAAKLANEKRYAEPSFGNITAAYLSWIEKNNGLALWYLKKVNPERLSKGLKDQYHITRLLIKASQLKNKALAIDEDELLPTLKWLDDKRFAENLGRPEKPEYYQPWNTEETPFTTTARNFYQQVLAPAFTFKGDTAKAALAMLKGDLIYQPSLANNFKDVMSYQTHIYWHQCLSEKTMSKLAVYKSDKSTTGLLRLLANGLNEMKRDDFYELQGTTYLRAHQYEKAIQCFGKLSKGYKFSTPEIWEWLENGEHTINKAFANPFAETVTDYPKGYLTIPNGINKKTFAQKMLRLQRLLVNDQKNAANYYYQLANGLYQTGEFGNSWFLVSYDSQVIINSKRAKYNYNADYKLALNAKRYYAKALSLSRDANFKAKCTFMLARCEQKKVDQMYDALNWRNYDNYEFTKQKSSELGKMRINNPYFTKLKDNYAATPFYKIAVGECSYLREFLTEKR